MVSTKMSHTEALNRHERSNHVRRGSAWTRAHAHEQLLTTNSASSHSWSEVSSLLLAPSRSRLSSRFHRNCPSASSISSSDRLHVVMLQSHLSGVIEAEAQECSRLQHRLVIKPSLAPTNSMRDTDRFVTAEAHT